MEGTLRGISYCIRKFKDYLTYCPNVEVRTTVGGFPAFIKSKALGARLNALVTEILSFPVTFKKVDKLRVATALEFQEDLSGGEGHKISNKLAPKSKQKYHGTSILVKFDGGCTTSGEGNAGFCIYDA